MGKIYEKDARVSWNSMELITIVYGESYTVKGMLVIKN